MGRMLTHAAFFVCAAALPAHAQQKRPEPDVKLLDCAALKAVIAEAPGGFAASRGGALSTGDIASYAVAKPLVGACKIIDKAKVGETSYACESAAEIRAGLENQVGDGIRLYCPVGTIDARVRDISLAFTTLVDADGHEVVVPNSVMMSSAIVRLSPVAAPPPAQDPHAEH